MPAGRRVVQRRCGVVLQQQLYGIGGREQQADQSLQLEPHVPCRD